MPPKRNKVKHYATYLKHLRQLCTEFGVDRKGQTPSIPYMLVDSLAQQYAMLDYTMNFVVGEPGERKEAEEYCSKLRTKIERTILQLEKYRPDNRGEAPEAQNAYQRAAARFVEEAQA